MAKPSGFEFGGLPKTMPSLVLDGVLLPETDLVHKYGGLPGFTTPAEEQVAVVSRRGFAQLCVVCHLYPFLDQESRNISITRLLLQGILYSTMANVTTVCCYLFWMTIAALNTVIETGCISSHSEISNRPFSNTSFDYQQSAAIPSSNYRLYGFNIQFFLEISSFFLYLFFFLYLHPAFSFDNSSHSCSC